MLMLTVFLFLVASGAAFDATTRFPLSTRQALIDKSKQLNDPTSPYSAGWSNRAATVLTPAAPGVYTADRPFYWNKIDVGCRATIIELPSSSSNSKKPDLWVHSPINLDGPMMQCLQELGTVKYIVTPNYEHTKFAYMWHQTYQDATMVGCPGLSERIPEISWTEIPYDYRPKSWNKDIKEPEGVWDTEILQALHINVEKNPFTGRPFFNEVIFYHVPTKTLLTTDLFWNYPKNGVPNSEFGKDDSWQLAPVVDEVPLGSRLWKLGMDKVYRQFYNNFMVTDEAEYKAIANHILNVWDVETVIPAHGDILRGKDFIRDVLTKFFRL